MALSPAIEAAIQRTAQQHGIDPAKLRAFVMIESGGNPNNVTGSYRGLLQLSPSEFSRHGGRGNIHDVDANLTAGAVKLKAESADFERRYNRQPTAGELYLTHQQGVGGAANHWANPDRPAWQNMADTAEGRQKGERWARQAIWGNVPTDQRARFGSVDNITSRDFTNLWDTKVARFGGGEAPQTPASGTAVAGMGGNATAAPFGMVIPTGSGTATADASPASSASYAAPEKPSGTENLFGSSPRSSGGLLRGLMADDPKDKEADPLLAQQQQLAALHEQQLLPQQPVDIGRLMTILQTRSRLGTA